jgi:hypothetical protein
MSDPYIDGDTERAIREALRQGKKLEAIASILRCSPDHLARLLGLPVNPAANMVLDDPDYLWAVDALDARL